MKDVLDWVKANKELTTIVVVAVLLTVFIHPIVGGLAAAAYVLYRTGNLDAVFARLKSWVFSKLGL